MRGDRGPIATRGGRAVLAALALLCAAAPLIAQDGRGTYRSVRRASPPPAAVAGPEPPLAPGDMIRLRFWQEPALSGDFPVDERGLVTLPVLGLRQVTLWPADQVKGQLIRDYSLQLRDQPAQVTMLRRVRVLGAVRNPGLFHVDPTMALGDVVALAGGPTPDAKEGQLRLYRNGRLLRARLDGTSTVIGLRSGDQIVVPRRPWIERNAAVVIGAALSAIAILVRG